MVTAPVNRLGDAGVGFALILTKRSRETAISAPQTTQNNETAICMMLRLLLESRIPKDPQI